MSYLRFLGWSPEKEEAFEELVAKRKFAPDGAALGWSDQTIQLLLEYIAKDTESIRTYEKFLAKERAAIASETDPVKLAEARKEEKDWINLIRMVKEQRHDWARKLGIGDKYPPGENA